MLSFVVRRLLQIIPTLILISIVGFIIIQLPPGDYLTTLQAEMEATGTTGAREHIEQLRENYGLDRPLYMQYWMWVSGFVRGDFGFSFEHQRPVRDLVLNRFLLDIFLAVTTMAFTWIVALPIGIYSATHKYSMTDHFFTGFAFLGLAVPHFLIALLFLISRFGWRWQRPFRPHGVPYKLFLP